jgi:hypothetical protein
VDALASTLLWRWLERLRQEQSKPVLVAWGMTE